jgi:hypothetical protein
MQDFSVESKTSWISSLSTSWQDLEARYKSSNEVNMIPRIPRTKHEKMKNFENLVRKLPNLVGQGASSNPKRNWRQGPTCRRGKTLIDSGSNTGKGGCGLGRSGPRPIDPGRPAQPTSRPSRPPFDLAASRAIYSPLTESHTSNHSSSATEEQRC